MALSKRLFMQDYDNTPPNWNEEAESFGSECRVASSISQARSKYAAQRQARADKAKAERELEAWGRKQDELHNTDNRKFYND